MKEWEGAREMVVGEINVGKKGESGSIDGGDGGGGREISVRKPKMGDSSNTGVESAGYALPVAAICRQVPVERRR